MNHLGHLLLKDATTFRCMAFWPPFWPPVIKMDTEHLTITKRGFLNFKNVKQIPIKDIFNVEQTAVWFVSVLNIKTRLFTDPEVNIEHLWRKDATKLRKLLQERIAEKGEA